MSFHAEVQKNGQLLSFGCLHYKKEIANLAMTSMIFGHMLDVAVLFSSLFHDKHTQKQQGQKNSLPAFQQQNL